MTEQRRLVADRYRRVWSLAQMIADEPGLTRADFAHRFHLSERQVQADLHIIRTEFGLPLDRDHGYRFMAEGNHIASSRLTLRDGIVLMGILRRAVRMHDVDYADVISLRERLPLLFPAHLHALVTALAVEPMGPSHKPSPLSMLADALVNGVAVRLTAPRELWFGRWGESITILPALLVPLRGRWYVIGEDRGHNRHAMLAVDRIASVTAVLPERRSA